MELHLRDVFCPTCDSYVHPFLDRCPACGADRTSRYDAAFADSDPDVPSLLDDPALEAALRETPRTQDLIAHRNGAIAAGVTGGAADADLATLIDRLAGSITYRSYGGPESSLAGAEVWLHLVSGGHQLRVASHQVTLGQIAPDHVLGVTFLREDRGSLDRWAGIHSGKVSALPTPAVRDGSLLVTYAVDGGFAQFGIGNRGGIFASRGRTDHYGSLAHWLGTWSGAEAQARWRRVGAAAHAEELGLREHAAPAAELPAPTRTAGTWSESVAPSGATRSVRDALVELEDLRAAHLVSDEEYAAKRREILARI